MSIVEKSYRSWFEKQLEELDIKQLIAKLNDIDIRYGEIKRYVLCNYHVVTYPKICSELCKAYELISEDREEEWKLLIDNLMEHFYVHDNNVINNI